MTADDYRALAGQLHTEAATCAVLALPLGLMSLSWLLAARWEGAAGLAVAAGLLWVASFTWEESDRLWSRAALLDTR